MMQGWSTGSKVGLAIAFCAVFATVVLLASRGTRAQPQARVQVIVDATPYAKSAAPSSPPAVVAVADDPSPPASAPVEDLPADADLSRQVMPLDETTAEQNEQRGDAIRRLGSSPTVDTAQPLIYVLRNDVDIRNRILAIDGLRRAALAGEPDRGINDALLEATRSSDEVIASQAGQALAEIDNVGR
jgi:hypothetical protein